MTPKQIYKSFELKVNKNSTNTNIRVPIGVFVLLFNEQKRKFLDDKLKKDENSNFIEGLEELLILDQKLELIKKEKDKNTYRLPKDFFKRVSSYSIASNNKCKNKKLYNWFVQPKNINILLANSDFSPSFEWEETLAVLNNNSLSIYKDDFEITDAFLSYYKEPEDLDIEGYTHPDGTPSKDVPINLSKGTIEEIIDRTVLEVTRNYESVEQYQLSTQRVQQNESI